MGEITHEQAELLFSSAPDRFVLGETSDFLIVEYSSLHSDIETVKSPSVAHGVRWLLLCEVLRFCPLRKDDAWAFENDAIKANVVLSAPFLESHWEVWFRNQKISQALVNGLTLVRALTINQEIDEDVSRPMTDWRRFASAIATDESSHQVEADHLNAVILGCKSLFDLIREDVDSCAVFVACPVEWLNYRRTSDVLASDTELADLAFKLHERYLATPFALSIALAGDLQAFYLLLKNKWASEFVDPWTPLTITLFTLVCHQIRFGNLNPADVLQALETVRAADGEVAATTLTFLFGAMLGSNRTHSLVRSVHPHCFKITLPDASQDVALRTDESIGLNFVDLPEQLSKDSDPAKDEATFSSGVKIQPGSLDAASA